ncbi:MAG: hypothetical protein O2971_17255 [Proteobacteria bacterium]|nr:hypothetical protein [Pseudomonadota bacterium]
MKNPRPKHPSDSTQVSAAQLLQGCCYCVQQCADLMQLLSKENFTNSLPGSSSIGAHMRHILDRFQSFFAGLQSGCIDYDDRKRDKSIECNPDAASFALASLARRVEDPELRSHLGRNITVRESVHHEGPTVAIHSTVDRELMGLVTHSIHHLAIISLLARSVGIDMGSDFGKAPSTIRYERG